MTSLTHPVTFSVRWRDIDMDWTVVPDAEGNGWSEEGVTIYGNALPILEAVGGYKSKEYTELIDAVNEEYQKVRRER